MIKFRVISVEFQIYVQMSHFTLTQRSIPAKNARFWLFDKPVGGFGPLAYHVKNCAKWALAAPVRRCPWSFE